MDRVTCAVGADELEQHLARKVLASLDHSCNAPIRDAHFDLAPALAFEEESHGRSRDGHVPVAKGGETEGPVLSRVLLVADAGERHLEQSHDGRDHLLTW